MPELIAVYEDHADERHKFAILTVHDKSVKSFKELDEKLTRIKSDDWQGKDLPFPVLLDGNDTTEQRFGIEAHPTGLLIDPDGNLVGEASPAGLEKKLAPLPAAKRWARNRDLTKNVSWTFGPAETPATFAKTLKMWTGCELDVDDAALKAAGLSPDAPLPGFVIGMPISLRSIDDLMLGAHGLGVAPSADGKWLVITHRVANDEPPSYAQKLRAQQLTEQLDHPLPTGPAKDQKPLDIKDQPLSEAVKLICNEFDLPMALDARAIQAHKLDPARPVSGRVDPMRLRQTLSDLVAPLGMRIDVRDEVVLITPRGN